MIDLPALGWDTTFAEAFAPYAAAGLLPARVARAERGAADLLCAEGAVRATYAGDLLLDPPTTGDWVALRGWPDGPLTVEAVLPRRSALHRGVASGESRPQPLAANVDIGLVVHALPAPPRLARLERLVSLVWESGVAPAVVLTKADLTPDVADALAAVAAAAPGAAVVAVSAVTGVGLDDIRGLAPPGRTVALLGPSGVGKSTLVNALLGAELLATREIRGDGKGRHTTTARHLVRLPGGGILVDTPGLRGIRLWVSTDRASTGTGVDRTFADVTSLAEECRFADCAHGGEPGCAVAAAVDDGVLERRRLDSWRKLQREAEWIASRANARLAAERRSRWREVTKAHRGRGRP